MNILHVGSCEIVEIRDSADAVGYSGPRTANAECSDCGSELCESHTETCAASVTVYSVLRACPSIHCSTPNLHQQTTGNVENEKGPETASDVRSFSNQSKS